MDKQHLAAYIKRTIYLSSEQLDFVLGYFKPSKHEKNELLLKPGATNHYMNFVNKGCVRMFFIREDGQEVTRHIVFDQQFATGLSSFITQEPSTETLQTMEKTELFRIARNDFYYLLNIIPAWEKFFRHYLELAYVNNLNIFQRETTKDAKQRYSELLEVNPEIVKRLPNKIVASYLNMSPETLSRLKSKL